MNLKKLFLLFATINFCLLLAIIYSLISFQNAEEEVRAQHELRYESYLLADEFRQNNDDFVRSAKAYTATGDEKHEKMYWSILAIQDGESPRPEKYNQIHWDYVMANKEPKRPNTLSISIIKLMEQAGFTDTEMALLYEAKKQSDSVVPIEEQAMNAVKGLFKDASGNYSINKEPDFIYARDLLYSETYFDKLVSVLSPIDLFLAEIDKRTLREVKLHEEKMEKYQLYTNMSVASFFIILIFSIITFFYRIIAPIKRLRDVFNALASGNLDVNISETERTDEMGDMAKASANFQDMLQKSTADNWVKSHLANLGDLIQQSKNLQEAARNILSHLTPIVEGGHSALYKVDNDVTGDNQELVLFGTYAGTNRKNLANRFALGEGLVGQCALEQQAITISNAPADYVTVISGTGESQPLSISVYPIMLEGKVIAVMEIASFSSFTLQQQLLLDGAVDIIALYIDNLSKKIITEELLIQSQLQSEELKASEEELRVSNEELQQQSEVLVQKTSSLQASEEELRVNNEALKDKSDALQKQFYELNEARIELEENTKKLESANKYKSEFLANMSHELRTPLNSILILAKNLASNHDDHLVESEIESAQIIHESGSHLLHLINDILDISKTEAGEMELLIEETSVKEIANNIERFFNHVAKEKDLTLDVHVDKNLPDSIETDITKLNQIINNILSNAFKFTEEGVITVNLIKHSDDTIRIDVIDTGVGIAEDKLNYIFEAFKQADGSTNRKYGGTGLGLTITRQLSELLGGKVTASSKLGKGTTFSVYLPMFKLLSHTNTNDQNIINEDVVNKASDSSAVVQKEYAENNTVTNTVNISSSETFNFTDDRELSEIKDNTILLIEDDAVFAKIVFDQVKKKGFKCIVCSRGEEGLALAKKYLPYGILLDINLPTIDGWSVLDKLKAENQTKNIPVHIMSANDISIKNATKDAVGFATKPVEASDIEEALALISSYADGKKQKVLIVEDDDISRRNIASVIENDLISLVTVSTGKAAIELLENEHIDCVILDIGLPDISGFDVIQHFKDKSFSLPPVIIYSSSSFNSDETSFLREHTDSIIIKGEQSEVRLSSELSMFLHSVHEKLPQDIKSKVRININELDAKNTMEKSVLIVDDDMRNSLALSKVLTQEGYKISLAKNGIKALERLKQNPDTDIVLMDIMMPSMDGYEAITHIRSNSTFGELPIIVLTAKAMEGDKEKSLACGANDFMNKPIDTDILLQKMSELLSEHKSKDESET